MFSLNMKLDKHLQLTPKLVSPDTPNSLQLILGNNRTGKDRKKVTLICFVYLGVAVQRVRKDFPWDVISERYWRICRNMCLSPISVSQRKLSGQCGNNWKYW